MLVPMTRISVYFLFFALFMSFSTPFAEGIGVVALVQSAAVSEGEKACGAYGVYNDAPNDLVAKVEVRGDLTELLDPESVDQVTVPANTLKEGAVPVNFCFDVPDDVYPEECTLGLFCKKTCPAEPVRYSGPVSIVTGGAAAQSGSSASLAIPFTFTIQVTCEESGVDYTPAVVILVAEIVVGGGLFFFSRRSRQNRSQATSQV